MSSVNCLKVLVCVFCSWFNHNILASNEGLYSVVAPGSIIPNRDFKVTVAVYHIKEPVTLKLAISGDAYNDSHTVDLPTDHEIKEITFKLPDLSSGDYALTAEGVSGLKFQNSISLYFQHDSPLVVLLTDKDDYIPGDKISYRVLVLNEQLRPDTYAKDMVICLLDPKRNKIEEARKSKVADGVYSGQFQLSKRAALGQWELSLEDADGAEYGARTSTFTFFYVRPEGLPRFSVHIDVPKFVSIKENEMKIELRVKHSYGNPLNGRAEIQIKLYTEKKQDNLYNRTITANGAVVKGLATFHIHLTDIAKHIAPIRTTYIATIKAAVEDEDSGEKTTEIAYVFLLQNRYIVTCADYSCQRPWKEKDNRVLIKITHLDGSLVSETQSPVKLIYSEGTEKVGSYFRKFREVDEQKRFEFEGKLDKSGLYEFKANISDFPQNGDYLAYYDISVEYKGEEHRIQQTIPQSMGFIIDATNAYFTPRIDVDFFLQIHGRKDDKGLPAALVVGDDFLVTLNSNEPIKYFIYNIVARSLILHTERVEFEEPKMVYNFTLKATHLTAPHFHIYAYYVDEQGVLHHTKSQFVVLMSLPNEISISAPSTGYPEEEVKLRIRTEPNSFVGILALEERISGRIKTADRKHDDIDYQFYANKLSNLMSFNKPSTELPRNHEINLSYLEEQLNDVHLHTYHDVPGSRLGLVTMTNAQIKERIFRYFDMDKDLSARAISAKNGKSAIRYPLKTTESWLFSDIQKVRERVTDVDIKLPSTLGTWIVRGFSLHPEKGLGVFQSNITQIRTTKPYSLFIHLPYSVKLGETVRIPVLIVNHLPDLLKVELALDSEANDFGDSLEYSRTQLMEIEEYEAKSAFFKFCPNYTGNFIPLEFSAISSVKNTTVDKSLMVIEDNLNVSTEYSHRAILVNLKDNQEYKSTFQFDLPNSRLVKFTLFSDPLGPVLQNLDISMPGGTGELTMSKMAVNFLVWSYLNRTKKLDGALDTRIKNNLREGYQNILNYCHRDGSFSYFDPPKANGSIWLTSYVLRYLSEIKDVIYVDGSILQKGFKFLLSHQHEDGSFTEDLKYFSRSGSSLFFTSSVLLALQKQAKPNTEAINKAVAFLRSQLGETGLSLAKSMAIYALQKSQAPESDKLLAQLRSVAKQDQSNDHIWWAEDVQHRSLQDVEITSYALLSLMDSKMDGPESAISTIRWLLAQRNIYGEFDSSQKTVIGLTALIEFAEKWGYNPSAWEVSISNEEISQKFIKSNRLTQSIKFPQGNKFLEVQAKGTGAALIQISYAYDFEEKEVNPSFSIQTTVKPSLSSKMELVVCVEFVEGSTNASDMVVLEVSLPSGYSSDKSSVKKIRDVEGVGSVDTKNKDSVVIVYFESLAKNESKCIPVEAYRTLEVTNLKPSSVVIYDNYGRKATEYYQLK
ncbi:alpha-2-macroglobulin-like [Drosophila santomea]|uniref:alpha-2-macroglobulin-like n=1 Tax=Drosophila santomea TaxID=129105 RepID=UPI0019548767|nr:alpha-2-macroglobulin-like [Drosophila santomea]